MKTSNVLLCVLAGAAVGAVAGILFAPDKGSATRKKILKKGKEYNDEMKDKFDELLQSVTKKFETLEQTAEDAVAKGKTKAKATA